MNSRLAIGFERTLRLPDDGRSYPLPPGLGGLPVRRVADCRGPLPEDWRAGGPDDLLLPLHEHEALFLTFRGADWKPSAVKIGAGGVNAVSGEPWRTDLSGEPQDYLVCPPQPWLDGINSGEGIVRQFVAVPLGRGQTIEGQVTGEERTGGLQILVFEPKPGRFPEEPPPETSIELRLGSAGLEGFDAARSSPLGLGAGGQMRQKIYPDPHGIETWEEKPSSSFHVHLVCAADWKELTGEEPPPTPIGAELYTAYGLPWFELDDEERGDLPPAPALADVQSVQQMEGEPSAPLPPPRVVHLGRPHPSPSLNPSARRAEGGPTVSQAKLIERTRELLPNLKRVHELLRDTPAESLLESTRQKRRDRGGLESMTPLESLAEGVETPDKVELPESDLVDQALQAQLRATLDAGRRGLERMMQEGAQADLSVDEQIGVEAIIELVGRPAILIQNGRFFPPPSDWQVLEQHREAIERTFQSVGRIEVDGHPDLAWVGTGFLVAPGILMTNRHVAIQFTAPRSNGRWGIAPGMRARVDFVEELGASQGSQFDITGLIGIHGRHDMALFRVAPRGGNAGNDPLPDPLPLAGNPGSSDQLRKRKVYVVGYPAWDGRRNDPEHMRRLFAEIYNVKRLQPGEILQHFNSHRLFTHNCSTLGGNSGSCVVDLENHRVIGLHFGGQFREFNQAVALWELQNDPLIRHAGLRFV